MGFRKLVNILYSMCISGESVELNIMAKLLDNDIDPSDALYIRECAYRAALIITGGKAYLWGMLKKCYMPSFMDTNTGFGGKRRNKERDNMLIDIIEVHKEKGVSSVILNPEEDTDRYILPEKIAEIKNKTDCNCKVAVRTGGSYAYEDTENGSAYMYNNFTKEQEIDFVPVIEFECREYSDRELAEIIFETLEKHNNTSCIILDFTACLEQGVFSDERIAQITAVLRLTSGKHIKNICVCPDIKKACISGANAALIYVDDKYYYSPDKKEYSIKTAFYKAGYNV